MGLTIYSSRIWDQSNYHSKKPKVFKWKMWPITRTYPIDASRLLITTHHQQIAVSDVNYISQTAIRHWMLNVTDDRSTSILKSSHTQVDMGDCLPLSLQEHRSIPRVTSADFHSRLADSIRNHLLAIFLPFVQYLGPNVIHTLHNYRVMQKRWLRRAKPKERFKLTGFGEVQI